MAIQILGTPITRPLRLTHVRDLEEFEGPLLSEYRDGSATYIEKWCTCDETTQRTLIVRSDQRSITEYLGRRISMWELLIERSSNIGFLHDYTSDGFERARLVEVSTLPPAYLPSAKGYHDPALRPLWARVPQEFLLGEAWDAELLRSVERVYAVAHAFTFAAHHQPELIHNVARLELRGWSYPRALYSLRKKVPAEHKPRTTGVLAASPGVLSMDSPRETAVEMTRALSRMRDRATRKAYNILHAWAKMDEKKSKHVRPESAETDIGRLCSALGIKPEAVLAPPDPDAALDVDPDADPDGLTKDGVTEYRKRELLQAGKLVAAYYRCLLRLIEPSHGAEFLIDLSLAEDDDEDDDFEDDENEDDDDDDEDYGSVLDDEDEEDDEDFEDDP